MIWQKHGAIMNHGIYCNPTNGLFFSISKPFACIASHIIMFDFALWTHIFIIFIRRGQTQVAVSYHQVHASGVKAWNVSLYLLLKADQAPKVNLDTGMPPMDDDDGDDIRHHPVMDRLNKLSQLADRLQEGVEEKTPGFAIFPSSDDSNSSDDDGDRINSSVLVWVGGRGNL